MLLCLTLNGRQRSSGHNSLQGCFQTAQQINLHVLNNTFSINSIIQRMVVAFSMQNHFALYVHMTGLRMNARLEYKHIRTYVPPKQISGIAGTGNPSEICRYSLRSQQLLDFEKIAVKISRNLLKDCALYQFALRVVLVF